MTRRCGVVVLCCALAGMLLATPARAAARPAPGPAYSVPLKMLQAGLHCGRSFGGHGRKPVLLVHGTTVTDEENWGWNYQPQLRRLGFDVCTVASFAAVVSRCGPVPRARWSRG